MHRVTAQVDLDGDCVPDVSLDFCVRPETEIEPEAVVRGAYLAAVQRMRSHGIEPDYFQVSDRQQQLAFIGFYAGDEHRQITMCYGSVI